MTNGILSSQIHAICNSLKNTREAVTFGHVSMLALMNEIADLPGAHEEVFSLVKAEIKRRKEASNWRNDPVELTGRLL